MPTPNLTWRTCIRPFGRKQTSEPHLERRAEQVELFQAERGPLLGILHPDHLQREQKTRRQHPHALPTGGSG